MPDLLILGIPVVIIVPAMVETAKRLGLPSVYAGLASIVCSAAILGLVQLQVHPVFGGVAAWAIASLVYGLASSGLFSQLKKLSEGQ